MTESEVFDLSWAADHAATVMQNVVGTLTLILDELADENQKPDGDTFNRWFFTVHWLKERIELERVALSAAPRWEPQENCTN